MNVELSGRPRRCRWHGDWVPKPGTLLRSARRFYVVMSVRSARSAEYPHNVTLGPIALSMAQLLFDGGAKLFRFTWD